MKWFTRRRLLIGFLVLMASILVGILVMGWVYRKEIILIRGLLSQDGTYLVVFQNSLELRPTGGYIGNFAEINIKNGRFDSYTLYNTNEFDFGKKGLVAPEPFQDILGITKWQLRDGNWDPDFPTSARQLTELYELEGGTKPIIGVVAVNSEVLKTVLEITGPVYIESIEEALTVDNVLLTVQYDLNFGFLERGVDRSQRKQAITELAEVLEKKINRMNIFQLYQLGQALYEDAKDKEIILYSFDDSLQLQITRLGLDGRVLSFEGDYLMIVDANLGALKTDYYMDRVITKDVEECRSGVLCHNLIVRYQNTAQKASPLNNDYRSYTRILLPKDAFVSTVSDGFRELSVDYGTIHEKKSVGFVLIVPFGTDTVIQIRYETPLFSQPELLIQKQPGTDPFKIIVTKNGVQEQLFYSQNFMRDQLIPVDYSK